MDRIPTLLILWFFICFQLALASNHAEEENPLSSNGIEDLLAEQKRHLENRSYEAYASTFPRLVREYESQGRTEDQLSCIQKGLAEAKRYLDPSSSVIGSLKMMHGEYLIQRGDFNGGRSHLQDGLAILENSEDYEDLVWCLLDLSMLHYLKVELDSAGYYLSRGQMVCGERLSQDHDAVYTINDLASIYANRQGNYREALTAAQESFDLQNRFFDGSGRDSIELGNTANSIASIHLHTGDLPSATTYFHKALSLYGKNPHAQTNVARSLNNLGMVHERMGDPPKALEMLLKARSFLRAPTDIQIAKEAFINLNNLVSLQLDNNNPAGAENFMQELLDLTEEWDFNWELPRLYQGELAAYKGDFRSALDFYKGSIAALEQSGLEQNTSTGYKHLAIGRTYLQLDNPDSALIHFQQAVSDYAYGFHSESPGENPLPSGYFPEWRILEALIGKGESLRRMAAKGKEPENNTRMARSAYMAGVGILQTFRGGYHSTSTRIKLSKVGHPLFDGAISMTLDQYGFERSDFLLEEAFVLAEKSRAQALLELRQESQSKEGGRIPAHLRKQDQQWAIEQAFYKSQLLEEEEREEEADSIKLETWRNMLFELEREREEWEAEIATHQSDYILSTRSGQETHSTSVKDSLLLEGEAMVEFFMGEKEIFTFVVSVEGLKVYRQARPTDFETKTKAFHRCLSDYAYIHDSVQANYGRFTALGLELYQRLLAAPLAELPKVNRLLLIPDGSLYQVAFEALPTKEVATKQVDFLRLPYLLRSHRVRYGYSASLLLEAERYPRQAKQNACLALAPSYGMEEAEGMRGTLSNFRSVGAALPGAQREVQSLARLDLEGDFLFGAAATEDQFKLRAPEYKILHLAMHGKADLKEANRSSLQFSSSPDTCEDAALHAYEIQSLPLQADLVVLSACESGAGKFTSGEGSLSLGRDFMAAGAQSVVMTLWQVEDKTGQRLMEGFYSQLLDGQSVADALHAAKISFLEHADSRQAHPFYWASYIANGDSFPLKNFSPNSVWVLLASAISLLFIWALFRNRKKVG